MVDWLPEAKAELARLGQTVRTDAELKALPKPAGPAAAVVLDLVVPGVEPVYHTDGYATCVSCDRMCWMGHETAKAISAGKLWPICQECAGTKLKDARRIGFLKDW